MADVIKVNCKDQVSVDFPRNLASKSEFLAAILDSIDETGIDVAVPSADLKQIIAFLIIRAKIEGDLKIRKPLILRAGRTLEDNRFPKELIPLFEPLTDDQKFSLLQSADHMNIPDMVEATAASIATRLVNWTFQQSEAIFCEATKRGLGQLERISMTDEFEDKLREENKWAEIEEDTALELEEARRKAEEEDEDDGEGDEEDNDNDDEGEGEGGEEDEEDM